MTNVHKFKRPVQAMAGVTKLDGTAVGAGGGGNSAPFTVAAGVVAGDNTGVLGRRDTITFAGTICTVGDANLFGATLLADNFSAASDKYLFGAHLNAAYTLSGGFDGVGNIPAFGMGFVQQTNSGWAGVDEAFITGASTVNGFALTGTEDRASWISSNSDDMPSYLEGQASSGDKIYFNCVSGTSGTGDGIVTLDSGTFSVVYIETP